MGNYFTETGKLDNKLIREKIAYQAKKLNFPIKTEFLDQIVEDFWFHDFYNHFIADKDYFNYLLKYLERNKFKVFSRFDYYSFLFSKLLKKSEKDNFYQLALFFEKQHSDRLESKEFNKLIKRLSLPLKVYRDEELRKRHLVKVEKVEETNFVIWNHHSLTEFLVTEYLLGKENPIEEYIKLAVLEKEGITAFKPSWSGVLRFLLESSRKEEALEWLLTFLETYPDNFDDKLGELISFTVDKPDKKTKTRVFNLIYQTYFDQLIWIPVWVRSNLYKFIDADSYRRLKQDIDKRWKTKTEAFVRRGNVVAVVDGMLEGKHPLINKTEKDNWKEIFVEFIRKPEDDGNGVLQRHCLSALENYKNEEILTKLISAKLLDSGDSLVRDAFISLCNSMSNSKIAINCLIEGIKKGSDIYARHGLYKITNKTSLRYFLTQISNDEMFLKSFLDHESIFDKEEGDWQLIEKIKELKNPKDLNLIKKVFYSFIHIDGLHHFENSNFIKQLAIIIGGTDKNFLFELINQIELDSADNSSRDFYDLKGIIALLLTLQNLNRYIKKVREFPEKISRWGFDSIYIARRTNGKIGQLVYQKAVKLGHIKDVDTQSSPWEYQEKQRKKDRLNEFKKLLGSKPGKFFIEVFKYYLQNRKEIDKFFQTKEGEKSKKLFIKRVLIETLELANPRNFKVKLAQPKNSSQFTWSTRASYYGDVLEVAKILKLPINKYRQKIIDYIPYCFSPSQILNLIEKIDNLELDWVNKVFSDPNDDRHYLTPSTYIYLVNEYIGKGSTLNSVKPVLLSFVYDFDLEDRNRISAIECLSKLIDESDVKTKDNLKKLIIKLDKPEFIKAIDDLLIQVFHDEDSINNRFELLKQPIKFKRPVGGHSVGKDEMELDYLSNAKPLIELKEEKYLDSFFDLLDHSFSFEHEEKKEYLEYVNYLWKIVISFIDGLKDQGSFLPILKLKDWLDLRSEYKNLNWLKSRLKELEKKFVNQVNPYDRLLDGIEEFLKDNRPISKISCFILKSQEVEFQLKKLLEGINYYLARNSNQLAIYRDLCTKSSESFKNSPLGPIINELKNYHGNSLDKLNSKIISCGFNNKRVKFIHKLFIQDENIHRLASEASKYINHSEEILKIIQDVWKELIKIKIKNQ